MHFWIVKTLAKYYPALYQRYLNDYLVVRYQQQYQREFGNKEVFFGFADHDENNEGDIL